MDVVYSGNMNSNHCDILQAVTFIKDHIAARVEVAGDFNDLGLFLTSQLRSIADQVSVLERKISAIHNRLDRTAKDENVESGVWRVVPDVPVGPGRV
jgi:hypothetical protein